jgi:hypothetical protein
MRKTYQKPALIRVGALPVATGALNGASVNFSDRRLKTTIERVGTAVFGLPLYGFSYLGNPARYTGVMAQDVLGVMPRAVSRDAAGFYRVDYGMLGIEMTRAA